MQPSMGKPCLFVFVFHKNIRIVEKCRKHQIGLVSVRKNLWRSTSSSAGRLFAQNPKSFFHHCGDYYDNALFVPVSVFLGHNQADDLTELNVGSDCVENVCVRMCGCMYVCVCVCVRVCLL